jgi:AcrR family transcriptional regulator
MISQPPRCVKFHRTPLCSLVPVTRKYVLKRRGERMEETRRRIVDAAIELHQTIGPVRTSVSAVAERAGVQRQTYYRHFPDERSLFSACTAHYLERQPLPDPQAWREIEDPHERLRRGLTELYGYYDANEPMLGNVIRDAEIDPLVREAMEWGVFPAVLGIRDVLAEALPAGRSARVLATLDVALDFSTWRTLVRRNRLSQDAALDLVVSIVRCAT